MRDIRVSAEVIALIGTESLRELEKDAYNSYECAECGSEGLTTEATSVVVHRYQSTAMVLLAHARCTQPKIVEFDADAPPGTGPEGDMRAMTLVLSYPEEPAVRPLLLLEYRVEAATLTPGGERISLTMAAMLSHGLALMSADGEMLDLAAGWQLLRPDRTSALLLVPDGAVAYQGGCDQPDEWAAWSTRSGHVSSWSARSACTRHPTRNSRSAACTRCSMRRPRPARWPAALSPARAPKSSARLRARRRRSWPVRSAGSGAPRSHERRWPRMGFSRPVRQPGALGRNR
jgi:hypothetical protein